MGTQGPGRKRIPNREKLVAEDDALNQIAREAEARLAAKRAARAEAREIRMKELERHQKEISDDEERMSVGSRGSLRPSDYSGFLGSSSRASSRASSARASPVVEDRMDKDVLDKGSRTASTLSAATLASLGGASSRRGSCDTSFSVETEASIREIKDSLVEVEEKYRKAMVSNAQLHNEKAALIYQVETLREELSDMEELLWEARRQHADRGKELEHERQAHNVLQFQFKEMRETLRHTEELLMNHGVSPEISTNGDTGQDEAGDDINEESACRLAQESPHGGRESILEQVQEQQPPENNCCTIYKHSQSLNVISTPGKTKPQQKVKTINKQARDLQGRTEKHTGRDKGAQKSPRNEDCEKDPTTKFYTRQTKNLLFGNEEIKTRSQTKKPGTAAQMYESKSGTPEELKDGSIYGGEVIDTVQIQEKTQEDSSENPECNNQTKTTKSLMMLPFVPSDMLCHPMLCYWGQSMLRGFVEYHDIVTKISRIVPLIPGPLSRWILELEDKLKNVAKNLSNHHDRVDKGSAITTGCKLPFRDLPEGGQIPEDRENVENTAGGSSMKTKKHLNILVAKKPQEKKSGSNPKVISCHDPYFTKPLKTTATGSGLDQGFMISIVENQAAGVVTTTSQQGFCRLESFVVPVRETQLKRLQTLSTHPKVDRSSKVKRFVEITADDLKVLAIPEMSLMSLQEGIKNERTDESAGSDTDSLEELLVKNSCKEVDGGVTAQQQATLQECQPAMEVVTEEVKVSPVVSSGKHLKGFSLNNRKHKHRYDCKSS